MLSTTFPVARSVRMMLLYFPMISKINFFETVNPSSFNVSRVISMIRSESFCSTATMRPPWRCFRSSMQNGRGWGGFTGFWSMIRMPAAALSTVA